MFLGYTDGFAGAVLKAAENRKTECVTGTRMLETLQHLLKVESMEVARPYRERLQNSSRVTIGPMVTTEKSVVFWHFSACGWPAPVSASIAECADTYRTPAHATNALAYKPT